MSAPKVPSFQAISGFVLDALASAAGACLLGFFSWGECLVRTQRLFAYPLAALFACLALFLAVRAAVAAVRLVRSVLGMGDIDEESYRRLSSAIFLFSMLAVCAVLFLGYVTISLLNPNHSPVRYLVVAGTSILMFSLFVPFLRAWFARRRDRDKGPGLRKWRH